MSFTDTYQDPQQFYAQMSPDQQRTAAQQFTQEYQQSGSPRAQEFAGMDPNNVTPDQLADMHREAAQNDPGLLQRVMSHPIIDAALVGVGIHEFHKHEEGR